MKSRIVRFKALSIYRNAQGPSIFWLLLIAAGWLANPAQAHAAGDGLSVDFVAGNLWLLVATAMVFVMHLGFASLEAGLTQDKNSINILFKNVCIIAIGILTYAAMGFNLMYPGAEFAGSFFGSGVGSLSPFGGNRREAAPPCLPRHKGRLINPPPPPR